MIACTPTKGDNVNLLGLDITRLNHASLKIRSSSGLVIYTDPYNIPAGDKADIILISHEHYDHCSPQDIRKIIKPETVIVTVADCQSKLSSLASDIKDIKLVTPGSSLTVNGIKIETVPAYNINKFRSPGIPFHPKQNEWVGFIFTVDNKRIYHAGDTDFIPEMKSLKNIDYALIPVSGTYVMTPEEAAQAVLSFKPKIAIPMHYAAIIGTDQDALKFKELAKGINVIILPKGG
ncbi:MBL fold metallo-hydrolase [Candidatus Woesearchaeota archaeon]|nr:MBL fold metallo-hydrolase [Candidatus Woesearchaeota archaeon]